MDANQSNQQPDVSQEKRVGFRRPTLIIPPRVPSSATRVPNSPTPKVLLSVPLNETPVLGYGRKTSQFMFDHITQIKNYGLSTAKTSLGFGERCAYWLYNKVKVLSKKWFTHCFLTIVLIIYTIGGALSFKALEEPFEGRVTRPNIRDSLYEVIVNLTQTSELMPHENQTEQWREMATGKLDEFIQQVILDKKIEDFIKANRGDKVWTIWNSIVFCATIYTTIEPPKEEIEAPKTRPRQKRRLQRGDVKRESTPIRFFGEENGEERVNGVNGREGSSSTTSETPSRQGSLRHVKKNSIELAQQELKTIINKTKKTLSTAAQRGRDRFKKYEQQLKRSQSAPDAFVEELRQSLKRIKPREKEEETISQPPSRQRHRPTNYKRASTITPKIIEVLDPKTQQVIQRKSIGLKSSRLHGLQTRSLKDLYLNYQIHKNQFPRDYLLLKKTFHKCLCELFLIILLCGCGGLMFKYVEGSFESFYKCGVKRVKRDFVELLWTKSHNLREDDWKSLARSRLRQFEEELHSAHEAGMTDYSGMRSWSFLNGIVYCLTIVTTIGYGHMYPKTTTGRALSIVYALIGIPLFLIALTDFGKLFTRGIKFVWSFVRRLYYTGSCRKVRRNAGVDDIFRNAQNLYDYATNKRSSFFDPTTPGVPDPENQPTDTPTTPAISNYEIDDEFNLPISVALFILVSYIFCGACMYMVIEKWNFFESFYFVFISMSTIGFGDYVPQDPVFMIGSIVYLVFGLALMSMCINVVQAKLSDTFKHASLKIGATMGFQEDDEGAVEEEAVVEENGLVTE